MSVYYARAQFQSPSTLTSGDDLYVRFDVFVPADFASMTGTRSPEGVFSAEAKWVRAAIPDVTAAVHYLTFEFTQEQVEQFAFGPVSVVCDQPNYLQMADLLESTKTELLTDLRP